MAILVLAAAALVGACGGSPGRPGYAGYWKAADEPWLGGPLLIHVDRNEGSFSVDGLRFLGAAADKATIEGGAGRQVRAVVASSRAPHREDDGRRTGHGRVDKSPGPSGRLKST